MARPRPCGGSAVPPKPLIARDRVPRRGVGSAECSDVPREVCELALAHVSSDRVEAAYRPTDLFERRRLLMQEWAAYVAPRTVPAG